MDVFSPAPRNTRELVSLRDCISPTPRNWKELERPGDVFSLALESKIATKSNGLVVKMNGKNNYKRKERKRQKRFCRFFLLGGRCE